MPRINSGTSVGGPLSTDVQSASQRTIVHGWASRSNYRLFYEHLFENDGAALESPLTAKIVGTTPTVTKLANIPNGVWEAALAATSAAETAGFDFADSLMINKPDVTPNFNAISTHVFQAWLRFPTALTTNQTAVIGLATAFNATLTSISKYAWFRLNANMNVLIESKDGTTTNTAVAPGLTTTLVANTFYLFTIDWTFLDAVKFFVNEDLLGMLNCLGFVPGDVFQPVIYVQKSSGTTTPAVDLDMLNVWSWRY